MRASAMSTIRRFVRPLVATAVVVAALTGGGAVWATVSPDGESSVIHACVTSASGTIKIVDATASCHEGEEWISWHQRGPAGEPGPEGPQGEPGPAGIAEAFGRRWGTSTVVPGSTLEMEGIDRPIIVSQEVPAGSFVVNALALFGGDSLPPDGNHISCYLVQRPGPFGDAPGFAYLDLQALTLQSSEFGSVPMLGTAVLAQPGTISVHCGARHDVHTWQPKLVAVRIDALS